MLLGENFRGRHERGLHAAARREKCRSRRDGGLAAAHVALHQPVHRRAGGEVVRDLPQHLLLCRRQAVGERGVKFRQCVGRDHDRALHAPLRPHELQARRKDEKFLKHQSPPRDVQRVKRLRCMHCAIGGLRVAEPILHAHILRQQFRQQFAAHVQRLLHALNDHVVG